MTASRPGRPATAYDVARLAGVSQSAVSRAFTPKASISEGTRAKIVEAATALNYRPNVIARSLITRRSRTIGLVAAYLQNHFYPDVLEVMSARLKERGYRILLFTADLNHPADPLLDEIIGYRVDGIILASITLSSRLAEECRAAGIPVLLFNRTAATAGISSVTGENLRGGRLIARFLAAGGHRRVAFMAGIENSSTSRDREGGFRAGLTECSLPLHRRVVGHYRFDCAAEATRALLSDPEPPDALFCANDHMALAAIEVARYELGLRVPEELSSTTSARRAGRASRSRASASRWTAWSRARSTSSPVWSRTRPRSRGTRSWRANSWCAALRAPPPAAWSSTIGSCGAAR